MSVQDRLRFTIIDDIWPRDYGRLMEAPLQSPLFARTFSRNFRHTLAVVALMSPLAWSTPSVTETRPPMFTADQEACFGRVYDAAHMKAHPKQKVSSIHVLRSLEERRQAENWTPDARAEAIRSFREDGQMSVTAFVNFRDKKSTFHNSLTCDKETRDGVTCLIECDGGSFRLTRTGGNGVLLHNNGFVLIGGCGEEVEESQIRHFSPGEDDKVFRLDSRPIAACRSEQQKATPIPAGAPLRERFKEDEQFCFGRDYDAAHLKSNPKQMVSQIRVGRLTPGKEREDDTDSKFWWFNVKLDVSVTLRSNLKTTTIRYACIPREGDWDCRRQHQSDAPSACRDRSFQLVRGPGDEILLQNRHSGLAITNECEKAETGQQFGNRPLTRSDDRTFRLTRMPIRQCQL